MLCISILILLAQVMPAAGADRLAITLWVEYGETIARPTAT